MRQARGSRSRQVRVAAIFAAAFVGLSPAAYAQIPTTGSASQGVTINVVDSPTSSPEPTSSPSDSCLQTRDRDNRPEETFPERGWIRVMLRAGCADGNEVQIRIDVESTPHLLVFADADANGGFQTPAKRLPAEIRAGEHEVVVRTIDHTYRAPITVVRASSGGGSGGTAGGTAGGAGGGSTSGQPRLLPRTGEDLVRLLLLASVLLVFGALVTLLTRRRASSLP